MMENIAQNSTEHNKDASHPMDFLLNEDLDLDLPTAGEIRRGEVIEHLKNAILIDIGAKSEGIIAGNELDSLNDSDREKLAIGNDVNVYVVDPEDDDGNIILSYTKAAEEQDWQMVEELATQGETYQGKVIGHNKGGLLVQVGQLRGFMPISQLASNRNFNRDRSTAEQLRTIVGEVITSKVIEVDRGRNRLILSERAAMKERRAEQREKLLNELQEGDVRPGRVVNLTDFGAFVDIGGIEGLVHISELSWKRVNDPRDVLQHGEEVEVYVLDVDQDRQRVALSLKRLQTDPWTIVDQLYHEGQLVEATITKLAQFGAFARIMDEYELEGLIHISELSEDRVNHPREVVRPDQQVTVRVIRVDPEQRQIGLSLKQVSSDRFMDADLAMAMDEAEEASVSYEEEE
ncbi:MAG TPA: S1 RNA-binding domain-containing protein [Candidatus Sulfomarinibacteraceae bacterium]|nr:S1 RNA-binding domain-containing protein [Candidatus Sulfomarinibacteraceae bacterium]